MGKWLSALFRTGKWLSILKTASTGMKRGGLGGAVENVARNRTRAYAHRSLRRALRKWGL